MLIGLLLALFTILEILQLVATYRVIHLLEDIKGESWEE